VTTREEDRAYSLLGIFDISMPLIYGEGREKAILRLRKEISDASKGKNNGYEYADGKVCRICYLPLTPYRKAYYKSRTGRPAQSFVL
jgi:hypothetical protein